MRLALITDAPFCRDVRFPRTWRVARDAGFEVGVFDQGYEIAQTQKTVNVNLHYPSQIPSGRIAKARWHLFNRLAPVAAYRQRTAQRVAALEAFVPDALWCVNVFDLEAACIVADRFGLPLVYEAYEYWPEHLFSDEYGLPASLAQILAEVERRFAPRADVFVTVTPTLARYYAEVLAVPDATVILNGQIPTDVRTGEAVDTPISARFSQHNEVYTAQPDQDSAPAGGVPLQLVHSGQASGNRNVSCAIEAVKNVADTHLSLLGYGSAFEKLRAHQPIEEQRHVSYVPAVAPQQVIDTLSLYDVGLILTDATTKQTDGALPNKLFDYLGAGLAVIAVRTEALESFENITSFARLIDAPDPHELAQAIDMLAKDRRQVAAMRAAARSERLKYTEDRIDAAIRTVLDTAFHTDGEHHD